MIVGKISGVGGYIGSADLDKLRPSRSGSSITDSLAFSPRKAGRTLVPKHYSTNLILENENLRRKIYYEHD